MSDPTKDIPSLDDARGELQALFSAERKYSVELWTVLQEVRLWAALKHIELPACARPNNAFVIDRTENHVRQRRIAELLTGEVQTFDENSPGLPT